MSYLTSGKPIVASISVENASAKILISTGAGFVIDPTASEKEFSNAVVKILTDVNLQKSMGRAGKDYALANFDGAKAANFFLKIIQNNKY